MDRLFKKEPVVTKETIIPMIIFPLDVDMKPKHAIMLSLQRYFTWELSKVRIASHRIRLHTSIISFLKTKVFSRGT